MKKTWIILGGLLLAGLVAGCASGEVKLSGDDDGRQIILREGQGLMVSLDANPSTGYTWEAVEYDGGVLRQAGNVSFEPESNRIGAGGTQTLRFEAVGAGVTTLRLVYHRPWENTSPRETFSVRVEVR